MLGGKVTLRLWTPRDPPPLWAPAAFRDGTRDSTQKCSCFQGLSLDSLPTPPSKSQLCGVQLGTKKVPLVSYIPHPRSLHSLGVLTTGIPHPGLQTNSSPNLPQDTFGLLLLTGQQLVGRIPHSLGLWNPRNEGNPTFWKGWDVLGSVNFPHHRRLVLWRWGQHGCFPSSAPERSQGAHKHRQPQSYGFTEEKRADSVGICDSTRELLPLTLNSPKWGHWKLLFVLLWKSWAPGGWPRRRPGAEHPCVERRLGAGRVLDGVAVWVRAPALQLLPSLAAHILFFLGPNTAER